MGSLLFQGRYHNWAKGAKFISKLPSDIKKRKAATEEVTRTLDRDLKERQPLECVVPYSAQGFRRLAIEWLVATDQVCFSHATWYLRYLGLT
jgi:hypothetical protein